MKIVLNIFRKISYTLAIIVALLLLIYGCIHIPYVQKKITTKIAQKIAENYDLHVDIKGVDLGLWNSLILEDITVYGLDSAITHNLHPQREKKILDLFSDNAWASATAPMLSSKLTDFDSPVFDFYGVKYIVVSPGVEIKSSKWNLVLD